MVSSFLPESLPASVSRVACLIPAGGSPNQQPGSFAEIFPLPFLRSWAGLLLRQVGHEASLLRTNWLNSYLLELGKIKSSGLEVSSVPFGFNTYL